ncbi:MAG: hypothetical protein NC926_10300 [Candidatus Omnitrophica bacterium]|nr:hypothetical protein [Candidatus Omnitrophota bacterium]
MSKRKIIKTSSYVSVDWKDVENVVFGNVEHIETKDIDEFRSEEYYKMLSGIVITKGYTNSQENYYTVYVNKPTQEEIERAIEFLKKEIESGELSTLDKIYFDFENVDKDDIKIISEIKKNVDEYIRDKYSFEFKEIPMPTVSERDFIKMFDTVGLARKNGNLKVLFKPEIKTKELKNIVEEVEKRNVEEVESGRWYE